MLRPLASNPHCRIELSTRVTSVATSISLQGNPQIRITTSNECHPFVFDEIVIAIPLGCLKNSHVRFNPPLCPSITQCIQQSSISSYEKVYLAFSSAWWDGTDGDGPTLVHFLTPKYLPTGQPPFSLEIVTLSNPDTFQKQARPVIFVQTYGDCAAYIISLVRHHDRCSPEYIAILADFFKPYLALLPHYDESNSACSPTAAIATAWLDDEFSGFGSYTNFKTSDSKLGEVVLDEGVRAMRKGEPERGLWFAGEHVAPFVALGTTTGAYWSGECAAMRIAAAHDQANGEKGMCDSALSN